jgi:circadian clock protein KaiC
MASRSQRSHDGVEKVATGIPGFDIIAQGGLPASRATLIAGTAGSGKTVFVTNFLAAGIQHFNEGVVLVTFEDAPADIRKNMLSFGWDIAQWERDGK